MISIAASYGLMIITVIPFFLFYSYKKNDWLLSFPVIISLSINSAVFLIVLFYFLIRFTFVNELVFGFWFIPVVFIFFLKTRYKISFSNVIKEFIKWIKFNHHKVLLTVSVFILYLIVIGSYLFQNRIDENGNLIMLPIIATEVNFHLSIISQLDYYLFPQTLQAVSYSYQHYHFFADLFIHFFSVLTDSDNNFLLYIYFFTPFFLLLIGLNTFSLAHLLFKKYWISLTALIIAFFCYDISPLVFWIKGLIVENNLWFGSHIHSTYSFWTPILTQFQLLNNPPFLMSTALFLGALQITVLFLMNLNRFGSGLM